MAVEHASELALIVASYLRKHGFAKTLTAFLRENGGTVQEMDIVDLETLYKLHISTQANGASKTKKSKLEEAHEIAKGDEDVRDDAEKALANLHVIGGTLSERKKKKKGEKGNVAVDTPIIPQVDQTDGKKAEDKMTPKEKKDSKKKRKEEELDSNGHAASCDTALRKSGVDQDGRGLATQEEAAHSEKSPNKKSKKEKKEKGSEPVLKETSPVDIPQVLSPEDGLSKKRRKKSIDGGKEETKDIAKPVSEVPISVRTEKVDATKQPVEISHELEGCETGSKKKRRRKDLSSGDANGSLHEPFDATMETTNDEEIIDSKKQSGKKKKSKEATMPVNGISNQQYDNFNTSPEKTKEPGEGEGVNDRNVEIHESGSAKIEKQKETPNNKKTPTGAMAFKRVEVEKVSFSDPRLGDNSYWAKDGAEEGYGAKAQEVLGLVRGRDFRHEKTKKKRGSYRGGFIGLQSHSIKFENSDDED